MLNGRTQSIFSNRIIVEIFFVCLCGSWTLISSKWRCGENFLDMFSKLAMALTNLHIRWHPIYQQDCSFF